MLRTAIIFCLLLIAATAKTRGEPQCLPKIVFSKNATLDLVVPKLGFVRGVATLCVPSNADRTAYRRCYKVDTKTGALSASAATRLMGRSTPGTTNSGGCVEGYCATPNPGAGHDTLFAISTDEAHAVILVDGDLHVFDTKTKRQTGVVPTRDEKAANDTNVSNTPIAILYLGHTLYVIGMDAGPFTGVWLYRDDGKRLGDAKDPRTPADAFSVYAGTASLIDDTHVALADAGLKITLVFDEMGKKVEQIDRPVEIAPCTADEMRRFDIDDTDGLPAACRRHLRKDFDPFSNVELFRLPNGDMLAALSGKDLGQLAVLDGKTLMEKRRIKLDRCRD